jgi:chemotaxis signal transduction protein
VTRATSPDAGSRALLERRARELARPAAAAASEYEQVSPDTITVLEIRLGEERVGVPLAQIVEIHVPAGLSAVPGAKAPVAGVTAWRGRVLTVLDLAHGRTGALTLGDATRVIVLGSARAAFGILADEVDDVRSVGVADLQSPDDPSAARAGIVSGVTRDALIVLDATALIKRHTPSA